MGHNSISKQLTYITNFLKKWTEDIWAVAIATLLIASILGYAWIFPNHKLTVLEFKWSNTYDLWNKILNFGNLTNIFIVGVVFGFISTIAIWLLDGSWKKYIYGFFVIYLLAIASLIIAGNKTISYYGIEYVVFALLIGLFLSNVVKLNALAEAARSEFFIKTGLVILGSSILFTDIVQAGFQGLLQSVFVVLAVWFFSLWLSRRLNVDDEFGVILASAVSICGVSAAIVANGAIQGDKKKLSYVTTLVLLVAIPMMILQPWIVKFFQIPELVAGAWLGGTLDTTASVAAATELVGKEASKIGAIVKFSQNVLIGIAAFLIATWWAIRQKTTSTNDNQQVTTKVIWERFPKFVLGFIAISLFFSFVVNINTVKQVSALLNSLRTVWFALAFVAIGLEAKFADLVSLQGGRPALVFIGAQIFNIFWTLFWAYILFGGILF